MTEVIERITRVETIVASLAESSKETNASLQQLAQSMTVLSTQFANPTAEHCVRKSEITELRCDVDKIGSRVDTLESARDTAKGGGRVILWILGVLLALPACVNALLGVAKMLCHK